RESAATVPYRLKMPPPPYVEAFATISTRSYGACEARSRNARLSNVRMYRSDPNASYVAPTGERRWIPSDGREMPDCAADGQRPHTLKSLRRSLNGEVAKSTSISRRPSFSNLPRSRAV